MTNEKRACIEPRSRAADISLYRTSISHLAVDFSFFSAQFESISPFALRLLAVIDYHTMRITIQRNMVEAKRYIYPTETKLPSYVLKKHVRPK